MDKKVIDFLNKEEAREIVTEVRDIPFSETNISKKIWNTLEYCRIQKTIGVVYGDAGIGKTRTMNEWCKDKTDVIVVTVTPAFASPKSFLKVQRWRKSTALPATAVSPATLRMLISPQWTLRAL